MTTTTIKVHPTNPNIIIFENVLLSYPCVFEPVNTAQRGETENMKYTCDIVIGKDTNLEIYQQTIEAILAKCPPHIKNVKKLPLLDGDEKDAALYSGRFYIRAKTLPSYPPLIVDMDGETQLTQADSKIRGGCLANAMISFFFYNKGSIGISSALHAIQYAGKGEAIGISNEALVKEGGFVKLAPQTGNFTNNVNYIQ